MNNCDIVFPRMRIDAKISLYPSVRTQCGGTDQQAPNKKWLDNIKENCFVHAELTETAVIGDTVRTMQGCQQAMTL